MRNDNCTTTRIDTEQHHPVMETGLQEETHLLRQIDKDCLSWGDTVHYQKTPLIVEQCDGSIIYDIGGNSYIDTGMWHSSCNFGYRNAQIQKEVQKQFNRLPQLNGDFLHREKLLIAEKVVDAIYERTGVRGRVAFNVGGALVMEDALKIVRKNTGKNRVAVMTGSYHGRSLGTLSLSSSHRYRQYFNEFPDRAVMFPFSNCRSCFYEKDADTCNTFCAQMIKKWFSNEFNGLATDDSTELGAIVVEPCQGRGYTVPHRDFFKTFIPELQRRNILVIDDEIQVGMFRTGKLFAFEHFGFTPDIITLSKSFTNGLSPVSLVWARNDLVHPDVYPPGHGHSNFANHPLGTSAALASWNYMMSQDYQKSVPEKGRVFLERLQQLQARYPFIHSVDGLGLLLNMVFADKSGRPIENLARHAATIAQECDFCWQGENRRAILQVGGPASNVLKFAPCLDISMTEIDCIMTVLEGVLNQLAQQTAIPLTH